MKKIIILCLCTVFIFGGCSYGEDVDNQSFVIAVGIDKGEVYPLRLTFVFANPSKNSSKEEKSPSSPNPDIVTVEAPTTFSAVRKLDAIKSKEINLTHTKIVVFAEEIAKTGVGEFLSGFASSRAFRPNTYVCISENAEDYLSAVKPSQEEFIEKYYDHIMQKVASGKSNEAYLYYLFFNASDKFSGSLVPLAGINSNDIPDSPYPLYTESDDFSYEARAGEIIRKTENRAEILGSAILRNDKFVGTLGSFETDLSRMIRNEYYPRSYSITYPEKEDYVTIRLFQQSSPTFHTEIINSNAKINITVPVSVEYVDSGKIQNNGKKSDDFCDYLEKELDFRAKQLVYDAQNTYRSDFLGLGNKLKHHFPDMESWDKFNWETKFSAANINISFKVLFADFEETN